MANAKTFPYYTTVKHDRDTGNNLAQWYGKGRVSSGWFVFCGNQDVYKQDNLREKMFTVRGDTYAAIKCVKNKGRYIVMGLHAGPYIVYIKFCDIAVTATSSNIYYYFTSDNATGRIAFNSVPTEIYKYQAKGKNELVNNVISAMLTPSSAANKLLKTCRGNGRLSLNATTIDITRLVGGLPDGIANGDDTTVEEGEDEDISSMSYTTSMSSASPGSSSSSSSSSSGGSEDDDEEDLTNGKYAVSAAPSFITNVGAYLSNLSNGLGSGNLFEDYKNRAINGVNYANLRNIFGAPYQFLPTTDCRINGNGSAANGNVFENSTAALERAGYEFSEKIISRMPLLFMTPGNTSFLGGAKQSAIDSAASNLMGAYKNIGDASLKAMMKDYTGKLYTIMPAYPEYFNYVNPMCRAGAVFLGLCSPREDGTYYTIGGKTLDKLHWGYNEGVAYELYTEQDTPAEDDLSDLEGADQDIEKTEPKEEYNGNEASVFEHPDSSWTYDLQNALYYRNSVPFYINSEASFQESFTNETSESTLASAINGLSDRAREIQFLLGTASGAVGDAFDRVNADGTLSEIKEQIDSIVSKVSKGNSIFTTIANSVKTIVSGGRMLFPQIWSNSNFNKSYSISIKLVTPSYDRFSWWLNIYVPLCHLMAFVLPRSEYVNSYTTPFLVKAFYKGMFNIDMGIITEMSFTRGKEGSWTSDGLPTVVDVSFTIQDLYSAMGMTSSGKMFKGFTLQNVSELDYLANLCGININQPDIVRMATLWYAFNITGEVYSFIPNLKLNIDSMFRNKAIGWYNNLWGL